MNSTQFFGKNLLQVPGNTGSRHLEQTPLRSVCGGKWWGNAGEELPDFF